MIKNTLINLLVFLFLAMSICIAEAAPSQLLTLTPKEKSWLKNNPNIKIAFATSYPRVFYDQDSNLKGLEIDLLHLIEKKLNINFEYEVSDWHTALNKAMNHDVDILLRAAKIKERESRLDFTDVYFAFPQAFVALEDKQSITDLNNLCGKKIAVNKSSSKSAYLKKHYPCIDLIEADNHKDVIQSVITGTAYAGFDDYVTINGNIKRMFLSNLKIIHFKYIPPVGFTRIGINNEKPILTSIMNKAIRSITKEEKKNITQKWFDTKDIPSPPIYLSNAEKRYLKKHTFTIATESSWKPFYFINGSGTSSGIGIDYKNLIESKLNIKTRIASDLPFTEILEHLKENKLDIFYTTAKTKDRENYSLFSKAYDKFPIAIATHKSTPFISGAEYLVGKKVAVGKNYSAYRLLNEKYPKIFFIQTPNTKHALKLVEQGKAFAAVDILPSMQYQIDDFDSKSIKLAGVTDIYFELRVMLNRKNEKLLELINRSIDAITDHDRYKIHTKWMKPTVISRTNYTLIWQIISITSFIIIMTLFWVTKLKNEIRKRKIVEVNLENLNTNLMQKVEEEVNKRILVEKEKLKSERMLIQQSKMAEMGEMMGAIIHQWKQPLNILSLCSDLIRSKLKHIQMENAEIDVALNESQNQTQFMSDTMDDFKNFFNPNATVKVFSPHQTTEKIKDMFSGIFEKKGIFIELSEYTPFSIKANESEFMQVILNIFTNAKDEINKQQIENGTIMCLFECHQDIGIIRIKDNAGGIPDDLLPNKIFEPHFTTKGEKGTGIGLQICKNIIEIKMKGKLYAQNWEKGAELIIEIPLTISK